MGIEFCLFLPNVIAVQTLNRDPLSIFLSSNKLLCAQAPRTIANNALNLYRSMPRRNLYDGMKLSSQISCEDLGYKSSAGEDPCFPGLETFHRNEKERTQFYNALESALKDYGNSENMTLNDANLVDSCKCKEESYAKSNAVKLY